MVFVIPQVMPKMVLLQLIVSYYALGYMYMYYSI